MTLTHMLNGVPTHHQQDQEISPELHDNLATILSWFTIPTLG